MLADAEYVRQNHDNGTVLWFVHHERRITDVFSGVPNPTADFTYTQAVLIILGTASLFSIWVVVTRVEHNWLEAIYTLFLQFITEKSPFPQGLSPFLEIQEARYHGPRSCGRRRFCKRNLLQRI